MKKLLSLILIIGLLFALAGCGGGNGSEVSVSAVDMGLDNVNNGIRDIIEVNAEMPTVALADETVQKAINDDLKLLQTEFMQRLGELFSDANEYTAAMADAGIDDALFAMDLKVRDAYVNGDILSIVLEEYCYTGGAHGSSLRCAFNYDLNDGHLLAWEEISADSSALAKTLKEYIIAQASSNSYDDYYFFDYYEEYLDSAFGDGTWYFSNEGLTIIYNQYTIAPYAAGIIEFTIPLEEIEQLALNANNSEPTAKGEFEIIHYSDGDKEDIKLSAGDMYMQDKDSFILTAQENMDSVKVYRANYYEGEDSTFYAEKLLLMTSNLKKGEALQLKYPLNDGLAYIIVSVETNQGTVNYVLVDDGTIEANKLDGANGEFVK